MLSDVSPPSHAPVYVWEPARRRDAPTKRAARYFTYISKLFGDDQGTHKIVGVAIGRGPLGLGLVLCSISTAMLRIT